jgi:hypothetical protein
VSEHAIDNSKNGPERPQNACTSIVAAS